MKFEDAVRALNGGRCERLELDGLTLRFVDGEGINGGGYKIVINPRYILSEEWILVNPKPIYEEVEVEKYYSQNEDRFYKTYEAIPPDAVKIKFTIKKEIKPKVKRRELICTCDELGFVSSSFAPRRPNSKIWEEWDE